MDRLIKVRKDGKFQQIVAPGTMRFLDFATLRLEKGDRHSLRTAGREYVLDLFYGTVTLTVSTVGRSKELCRHIGKRADVFSGPPVMSYIPPNSQVEITAESPAEMGLFSAPSSSPAPAALLEGSTVVAKQVGRANWQRTVYAALGENVPAECLLAGETLNPPGNWSSFPPNKHDTPTRRKKPCSKKSISSASNPRRVLASSGLTSRRMTGKVSPACSSSKTVTRCCCQKATIPWWPRPATNSTTRGCSRAKSGATARGLTTRATPG